MRCLLHNFSGFACIENMQIDFGLTSIEDKSLTELQVLSCAKRFTDRRYMFTWGLQVGYHDNSSYFPIIMKIYENHRQPIILRYIIYKSWAILFFQDTLIKYCRTKFVLADHNNKFKRV